MAGFAIHITKNEFVEFKWIEPQRFRNRAIQQKKYFFDNIRIDYRFKANFPDERLHYENEKILIIGKGVVSNLSAFDLHHFENEHFFKDYKGHFCGAVINKFNGEVLVFNNQSGTQKLFYYQDKDNLIVSTDFYTTTNAIRQTGVQLKLNIDACYLLLSSGFMHEDYTLFEQIKQIRAGEYLSYNEKKQINKHFYFHLNQIKTIQISYPAAIEQLDEMFRKAVAIEYELDKKYGYPSYTTLSGGLDSRMVALTAYDLGYKNQHLVNFSQPKYADEIIAQKIAKDYKLKFKHISLFSNSLTSIDENIAINGGLTIYTGASHVYSAMCELQGENIGIIHTGNIGDAVLGSFITNKQIQLPDFKSGMYSEDKTGKSSQVLSSVLSNYASEELFKFYNRAFLGANNGFLYYDLVGESSSPFLEPDFLAFAYSLPREYKYKSRIYIDWIKQKHPEYAQYIWEAIGGKPTNNHLLRLLYRIRRAIVKRLPLQTIWKNTMNPEQLWYDSDTEVKTTMDQYFEANLKYTDKLPDIQKDLKKLYQKGDIQLKAQVLTLLSALKLHLG